MENETLIDAGDPLVVAIAWLLTAFVGVFAKRWPKLNKVEYFLPAVALIVSIIARVIYDYAVLEGFSWETLPRALAAAGVAVFSHSQVRELVKIRQSSEPKE